MSRPLPGHTYNLRTLRSRAKRARVNPPNPKQLNEDYYVAKALAAERRFLNKPPPRGFWVSLKDTYVNTKTRITATPLHLWVSTVLLGLKLHAQLLNAGYTSSLILLPPLFLLANLIAALGMTAVNPDLKHALLARARAEIPLFCGIYFTVISLLQIGPAGIDIAKVLDFLNLVVLLNPLLLEVALGWATGVSFIRQTVFGILFLYLRLAYSSKKTVDAKEEALFAIGGLVTLYTLLAELVEEGLKARRKKSVSWAAEAQIQQEALDFLGREDPDYRSLRRELYHEDDYGDEGQEVEALYRRNHAEAHLDHLLDAPAPAPIPPDPGNEPMLPSLYNGDELADVPYASPYHPLRRSWSEALLETLHVLTGSCTSLSSFLLRGVLLTYLKAWASYCFYVFFRLWLLDKHEYDRFMKMQAFELFGPVLWFLKVGTEYWEWLDLFPFAREVGKAGAAMVRRAGRWGHLVGRMAGWVGRGVRDGAVKSWEVVMGVQGLVGWEKSEMAGGLQGIGEDVKGWAEDVKEWWGWGRGRALPVKETYD